MSEKNNPAAFPRAATWSPDGQHVVPQQQGMTLRDWFAGRALAGMCAMMDKISAPANMSGENGLALQAYLIADAMLAARQGTPS